MQTAWISAPLKPSVRSASSIDLPGDRLAAQADPEDLLAAGEVGQGDLQVQVEAAGAQQGRVEDVRAVGGPEDQNAVELLDAVQLGEELADDPLGARASRSPAAASWDQGVDLVEEDDAGRRLLGLAEDLAHAALGLADVLRQQRRALDRDEVDLGLAGDGLGQQRLAAARAGR